MDMDQYIFRQTRFTQKGRVSLGFTVSKVFSLKNSLKEGDALFRL